MDISSKIKNDKMLFRLFMGNFTESLKWYSIFKYIYDLKGEFIENSFFENEGLAVEYLSSLSEEEQLTHMKESLVWMGTIGFDILLKIIKDLSAVPVVTEKKFILH